jgi:hypothetical protein
MTILSNRSPHEEVRYRQEHRLQSGVTSEPRALQMAEECDQNDERNRYAEEEKQNGPHGTPP